MAGADDSRGARAGRHAFRFFVDEVGAKGAIVPLSEFDARHARVLHGAQTEALVEVVDGDGVLWTGRFDGPAGRVVLEQRIGAIAEREVELLAFVTVGGKTDELVDAAVQAGATRVVPVVRSERDRAKVDARADRLTRIATSAAKQAKRARVPEVATAVGVEDVLALAPGVVVDPSAPSTLDAVLSGIGTADPVRLLIGAADGFPAGLVEQLADAGWQRGRLGPSILRAELAAALAVAIATMHTT